MIRLNILLLFWLLLSCQSEPSEITQFLERDDLRKYYVSQSILRMANTTRNEDFNHLIYPIEHVVLVVPKTDRDGGVAEDFQDMNTLLEDSGYGIMMSTRMHGQSITIYHHEALESFAITGEYDDKPALIIVRGKPDLKYISALNEETSGKFLDIIQGGGPFHEIEID